MHSNGIIHRDLKPLNILLSDSYKGIKIGDLGVACKVESASKIASPAKSLQNFSPLDESLKVGTPFYLAPEIWDDQPYSMKSDMWALGVVLYELISK